jgi:hypothetical protein
LLSVAGEIIAYEYSEVLFRSFEPTMKIATFLLPLAFTGALSLFAQGAVSHAPSLPGAEGIAVDAGNSTAGSGAAQSIVPIPDCFPCSEDNDPYSEGPADYPPIPFPKPPGLPKCYPICNLDGGPDSSLSPSPLAGVVPRGDSAPVVRQIKAVPAIEPSSVLRRSRLSRG